MIKITDCSKAVVIIIFMSIIFSPVTFAICSKEFNANIQHILDQDRLNYQIPGLQVSILCPGEKSPHDFVSGFTTLDHHEKIKNDTWFQIGSETKSFIAAIILKLEANNLVSINDEIGMYLTDIPSRWKHITIKQLLNHTSGIYHYTDNLLEMMHENEKYDLKKQWTAKELITIAANEPDYFLPGQGWHYSNTNLVLTGLIIESVTGKSISDVMTELLLIPIGLLNTHYLPVSYSPDVMQHMAHGYSNFGIFSNEPKDITDSNFSWSNSANSNVSTSHDIAIWFNQLTNGSILPKKQMNELMELVNQQNGQPIPISLDAGGYALALMHDYHTFNEESWWHSGGTLGFCSFMINLKNSNFILTANANMVNSDEIMKRHLYLIVKDLVGYIQRSQH